MRGGSVCNAGGEEKDVQAMHPFNDIEPTPTIFDDVGVQSDAESRTPAVRPPWSNTPPIPQKYLFGKDSVG
eukprot:4821421-Amphidinium_carterae.1